MEGGDGTSIRIWTDPCLPSAFLPFGSSPVAQAFEEAKVESLIDPVTKEWHSATIQSIFSPRDAKLIMSIPLSSIPVADKLVWPYSPTGVYTVKSGYRFLCRSQNFEDSDYQPVETNLWKKRMVISDDLCDHCKSSPEDTVHAL
ncbi:uncharacterized protein LOC142616757 [Castanea sativa]|uniref:uncharacterized protein LOC142616757 n=1 Tax=Castanea sativa TaxID=21020 RepID=UPI003F64BF15